MLCMAWLWCGYVGCAVEELRNGSVNTYKSSIKFCKGVVRYCMVSRCIILKW